MFASIELIQLKCDMNVFRYLLTMLIDIYRCRAFINSFRFCLYYIYMYTCLYYSREMARE